MNNKERNYRIAYEAWMILAAIALLSFICRLWPVIILALVGTIIAAIRLLFLKSKTEIVVEQEKVEEMQTSFRWGIFLNRSQLISMQSKREIPCSMIPICISTQIIHTHLPILTVALSELLTASREYWSVNPVLITMLLIGQTEPILFTMNCSSDFILLLLMSISARSPLFGGIIPMRIWQCLTLFGTEIRKT